MQSDWLRWDGANQNENNHCIISLFPLMSISVQKIKIINTLLLKILPFIEFCSLISQSSEADQNDKNYSMGKKSK